MEADKGEVTSRTCSTMYWFTWVGNVVGIIRADEHIVGEKRNLVVDPAKVSATITTRRSHHAQHLGHICEEIFESTVIYPNILKMTTMVLYIIMMMMVLEKSCKAS